MKKGITLLFSLFTILSFSQKKILDHKDTELWNTIEGQSISNDGQFVLYTLRTGEKDAQIKIKESTGNTLLVNERSEKGKFTYNSKFALFSIKAWKDSINDLRRRKVKDKDLPKDTLAIFNLESKQLEKIANVKSYKSPQKWSGFVAYTLEEIKEQKKEKDTTSKEKKKKKAKKVSKKNGYHLVLRNLTSKAQDTFKYVKNYMFAKEGKQLAFVTTGKDSTYQEGIYVYDIETKKLNHLHHSKKAKYFNLNFSDTGNKLAFVTDEDTTKIQIKPYKLFTWNLGEEKAKEIVNNDITPKDYLVSKNGNVFYSKDESKLYFGLSTKPIVQDTMLLEEEIVNVEVWTYDEPRLYTVQELQVKNDRKKAYQTVYHLNSNKLIQIATEEYPNSQVVDYGNSKYALVSNPKPYQLQSQWTARSFSNHSIVNVETGEINNALTNITSYVRLSPKANYIFGYHAPDSTWFTYDIKNNKRNNFTKNSTFYDELNDYPDFPSSYGSAGWTEGDKEFLVYDRYDIWSFNPKTEKFKRLTKGRETSTVYRYIKLNREEKSLPNKKWLLSTFNDKTKNSGYAEFNPKNNAVKQLVDEPFRYTTRPQKAKKSDNILFTKQSFKVFPDLLVSDLSFKKTKKLSDANPQQKDYNWGTGELITWSSLDGKELTGMLYKPENFDPNKKYPMIVNFYERSSDRLHAHRAPSFVRSTISYSFYLSRGYVIFNPDVHYRVGYPGESAFNCVIPGVTSLIEQGFIDKDNIGVQGHSWGGYQIAYLVTKTDIFKAAESGAPVPNMISAYGGIRWWTGLSRQFQYEHTQSRIGGTPWEYPQRYIENSPIFNIDKINTPLLIMHNDADGHVPWYQGIEFFVGLRRLGKPSWFLNYNDEPHWPLKYQNRKDFTIRMAQYFDYYLKGAPKPVWMERGVPAIEKGINQGYELIKE